MMTWSRDMRSTLDRSSRLRSPRFLCVVAGVLALTVAAGTGAQEKPTPAPAAAQKTFATAREAADALVSASESFDAPAMEAILGPDGADLVVTGEPVKDREAATAFAARAREKLAVDPDPKDANRAIVSVGNEDWPLPIPIVRKNGTWLFDSKAGRQEILYRRIGDNELDAIQICHGYVEAQHEYALVKRDGSEVNQYAQRIISTPGRQDGLAWRNADGTWEGPVGEHIARIIELGYTDKASPYHGYFFKVLKGQGPAAPMGEMDFVVKGVMIGGFALVAVPSEYLVTGVKTFIVSHDGIVYEKDLGDGTPDALKTIERYNPDKTWKPVVPQE
jgi:Protein of unknown function (DUF2950)